MQPKLSISDAVLINVGIKPYGVTVLKENDHLLRRFGQVDYVVVPEEADEIIFMRGTADEIWAVVEGIANFVLEDQREESPTKGQIDQVEISADSPMALLVPFGVACRVSSTSGGKAVRITTHEDDTSARDKLPGK